MTKEETMMHYFKQGKTYEEARILVEQEERKKYIFEARNKLFKALDLQISGDEQSDLNILHRVLGINQETVAEEKRAIKKEREEILNSGKFKINTEYSKFHYAFNEALNEVKRVCGINNEDECTIDHAFCNPEIQVFNINNKFNKLIATITIQTPDFYSCDVTPKISIDFK